MKLKPNLSGKSVGFKYTLYLKTEFLTSNILIYNTSANVVSEFCFSDSAK